jgi:hypothetical protein
LHNCALCLKACRAKSAESAGKPKAIARLLIKYQSTEYLTIFQLESKKRVD